MQVNLTSVSNPQWANREHTVINCNITTSQFGDRILPFTADSNDFEAHGRAIFASIVAGEYGPIAAYVAPPQPDPNSPPPVRGAQTL